MKTAALSLAVGVLLSGAAVTTTALADDMAPTTMPAMPMPSTQPTAAAANKTCPVSGDAVDPNGPTVQYKGKAVGFCCADCVKEFNKDPDKYASKIK